MAAVVVVARNVERDEDAAARFPALVLAPLARRGAEDLAPAREPRHRIESARAAVAPFVVARHQDEAVPDARELRLALEQPRVAAGLRRAAGADVADVHHELERLGV